MRFSTVFTSILALAVSSAVAAPVPKVAAVAKRQGTFAVTPYSTVQISDGVAGNAQAEAEAACVQPFAGLDLASIDSESVNNLAILRKAAEEAESDFNDAIDEADGDALDALKIGKSKNKVLKLTCLLQVRLIKQAQGDDVADQIADTQKKLAKNISNDVAKAGAASCGLPTSTAALASAQAGEK